MQQINKAKTLMKVIFKDDALSDLYEHGKTNDSKYKKCAKTRNWLLVINELFHLCIMLIQQKNLNLSAFCTMKN